MKNNNRFKFFVLPISLVLLNFIIKGLFLGSNSLAGDEPYSVYHAQMSLSSIIHLLSEGNNPPLYELLLHFWIDIFGISKWAVRFPPLLFSCASVYFMYKICIKFFHLRVAIIACIIFIFSNYQIYFAHEARVYSLLGFLSLASMYYYISLLSHAKLYLSEGVPFKNRKLIIALILSNTLIIYAHYFGFFILFVEGVYLFFNPTILKRFWKQILVISGIIFMLYSPFVPIVLHRFLVSSSEGTWVSPPNGLQSIYSNLRKFSNQPVVAVVVIATLILSFVKFIYQKKKEKIQTFAPLIVFWFLFLYFFMFGISYIIPLFLPKYLMPVAVAFPILVGICANYILSRPIYAFFFPLLISILFITTVQPNYTNKRNVEEMMVQLKKMKRAHPNASVIICPSYFLTNFITIENYLNRLIQTLFTRILTPHYPLIKSRE